MLSYLRRLLNCLRLNAHCRYREMIHNMLNPSHRFFSRRIWKAAPCYKTHNNTPYEQRGKKRPRTYKNKSNLTRKACIIFSHSCSIWNIMLYMFMLLYVCARQIEYLNLLFDSCFVGSARTVNVLLSSRSMDIVLPLN